MSHVTFNTVLIVSLKTNFIILINSKTFFTKVIEPHLDVGLPTDAHSAAHGARTRGSGTLHSLAHDLHERGREKNYENHINVNNKKYSINSFLTVVWIYGWRDHNRTSFCG